MIVSVLLMTLLQSGAAEPLKPNSGWTLDNRTGCVLSRRFDSADGEVTFGIKPDIGAPGGELVLMLPGRGGRYEVDEGRITVNGDGAGASYPAVWSRVGRRDQPLNGVTIQPSDGFWRALPDARMLTMDIGKRQQVSLDLGSMSAGVAALSSCRAEKAGALASARKGKGKR